MELIFFYRDLNNLNSFSFTGCILSVDIQYLKVFKFQWCSHVSATINDYTAGNLFFTSSPPHPHPPNSDLFLYSLLLFETSYTWNIGKIVRLNNKVILLCFSNFNKPFPVCVSASDYTVHFSLNYIRIHFQINFPFLFC